MRSYFNPNGSVFKQDLSRPIYVDKSLLISLTNKSIESGFSNLLVTRPRRFGKTYLAEMLCAYYTSGDDTKSLFDNLKISKDKTFLEYLNKFNVLYLNPMDFGYIAYKNNINPINALITSVIDGIKSVYKEIEVKWKDSLLDYIKGVYSKNGKKFVIIIDEYDYIFREYSNNKAYQEEYLYFLNSLFKSSDSSKYIALAYLTGILPIMKSNTQSKLNNFRNISMLNNDEFSEFIGFNDEEVRAICEKYNVDYEKMKLWYDGYEFGDKHNVYCPNSVVQAAMLHRFDDYWTNTSSSETIKPFIRSNKFQIRDEISSLIAGESILINPSDFNNTIDGIKSKDDLFTYFTHLGYLAYTSGEIVDGKNLGYVRIPNYEIRQEFSKMIYGDSDFSVVNSIIDKSSKLLEKTIEGNEKYVSSIKFNDENSLSCVLILAYFALQGTYNFYRELPTGKGFADLVFVPVDSSKPAFVFELKYNKDAYTAINQIYEKNYPLSLDKYKGNIILVGINYEKKSKKYSCLIKKA